MVSDDFPLIDACLRGDRAAFGQLVRQYQDRLFNSLFHVLGSREEAEDVAQDAFVQAFTKLNSFQKQSGFFTWLYRIAFNLAMSRMRRKRPESSIEMRREGAGEDPVDSGEAPSDAMLKAERAEQVRSALAQLSEDSRSILILREIDGCDYENIAEILEVPIGTVRSRLHRARLQLKEQLKSMIEEETIS